MNNQTVNDGKTSAIISHFWILGTIIAFFLNLNSKNSFASFYIRQMIGLHLLSFLNGWLVYKYLGGFIGWGIGVVLFIFWIISILGAFGGEKKLLPVFGEHFQNWFKSL